METSLRCGGGVKSKGLRLHAKENFPIGFSNSQLQVHGELDTGLGTPSYCSAILRTFSPYWSASMGVGLQYNKQDKLRYCYRAKKAFPVTTDGLVSFNMKGRYEADSVLESTTTTRKSSGAAEFTWNVLNFREDQDVRFKLGYEVFQKVPYLQIRENNWTFNADAKGRWNVRYDL